MGDVDMEDVGRGGVLIESPINNFFAPPKPNPTSTQMEADLYSKLKKLERNLEFLSLQEVSFPLTVFSVWILIYAGVYQR
jgi:hypothetical protein